MTTMTQTERKAITLTATEMATLRKLTNGEMRACDVADDATVTRLQHIRMVDVRDPMPGATYSPSREWRVSLTAEGREVLASGETRVFVDYVPTTVQVAAPPAPCQCGEHWGEACHELLGADAVTVEVMPEHLRASHTAAGNRGVYPHNGARRIRVTPSCGEAIVEADSEWAEIVG